MGKYFDTKMIVSVIIGMMLVGLVIMPMWEKDVAPAVAPVPA
tara:strand:+ start:197 stop:322 length:126 start_codon:yes stop_codon:yes gene_type:complete